jgi:hypothetical protein
LDPLLYSLPQGGAKIAQGNPSKAKGLPWDARFPPKRPNKGDAMGCTHRATRGHGRQRRSRRELRCDSEGPTGRHLWLGWRPQGGAALALGYYRASLREGSRPAEIEPPLKDKGTRAKPESLYPDEPRGRSPLADARVDLNASLRDTPTLVSL